MLINLSTKQLRAFIVLAECRNFTQAARRSHLSQPAFSALIQRLEEDVGARLFERSTRHVHLTPEGQLFLQGARHLLEEFEWRFHDLNDYVTRQKGRVRIAALPSIAAEWLPQVIARYRAQYPGIAIEIHDVLSDRCLALLQSGQVDLALAAPLQIPEGLYQAPLWADCFFMVCRQDHPLAQQTHVTLAEVHAHDVIRLARETSVQQHLNALPTLDRPATASFEVENLATAAAMIRNGLGITLLPELTLSQFRHPSLRVIPLATRLTREIFLLREISRPLSIAAQTLWKMIEQSQGTDQSTTELRQDLPMKD